MLEIRQSAIRTYLRCPLQYYFRYVKELIRPPGIAAVLGTAVHKSCEIFWKKKSDGPSYDEGMAIATDTFEQGAREAPDTADEVSEKRRALPLLVHGAYRSVIETPEAPLAVEHQVSMQFDDVRVYGTLDLITEDNVCWDHKTGKRYTPNDAETSYQLAMYAIMAETSGLPISGAGLVWIRESAFYRLPTLIDDVKKERAIMLTISTLERIKAGDFPPANLDGTNAWWCSPRWCGYHQAGRFGGPCKYGG